MRVLVLDARSSDRTVEFAQGAGATVVQRDWTDYVDARGYAISLVRTPWVLMLDADEALDDVLRDAIAAAPDDGDGYALERTTFYCGKALRMWSHEPLLRLFRREGAHLQTHARGAAVHEYWICDGPTGRLPGVLLHYSYPDVASYRAKFERYTAIEAAAMRFSLRRLAVQWLLLWPRWVWLLVRRGAVLDGLRGIGAAYWSARYRYVVARKAR